MNLSKLRDNLADTKSRIVFDARINYINDKRLSTFYQIIKEAGDKYTFREVDAFVDDSKVSHLLIWGNGDCSEYSYQVLKDSHYPILGLVYDSFNGKISSKIPHYYSRNLPNIPEKVGLIVFQNDIISVPANILETYDVLNFPDHVVGRTGKQYFDFFEPKSRECFLDGGCMDGSTTKNFIKWCNGNYDAVYAFEPNPEMVEECKKYLRRIVPHEKLAFYEYALWNQYDTLMFDNSVSKWSACVDNKGQVLVTANSIDAILKNKKVTFIKLDIEGSEMEALMGARDCIKKYHPRMAVSVYHHQDDMVKIIQYLTDLSSDYRFALRHYHSDTIETILYVY